MNSRTPNASHGHQWLPPSKPWERVHLPFAKNFRGTHFLIIVDAQSKWIEVFPQPRLTTAQTTHNLLRCFATYGIPKQVHTDNGCTFTSAEFEQFMEVHGIKHTISPAYSPRTHALAERAVQLFKDKMRKNSGDLHEQHTKFLFHYRTTVQESTQQTPAFLIYGRELRTKLSLVQPEGQTQDSNQFPEDEKCFSSGDVLLARDYVSGKDKRWRSGEIV